MTNRYKGFQNSSTFSKLSDFHKITLAVLKVLFKKQKRKVLNYRKSMFQEQFLTKLNHVNVSKQDNSLKGFQEKCLTVLNSVTPIKRKFIRANQASFMNKELQQFIMVRSKMINSQMFIKNRSLIDKNASKCICQFTKKSKEILLSYKKNIVENKNFGKR